MKIYSKLHPAILLHILNKRRDITRERRDIVPENQYLQVGTMKMVNGQTFRPHRHLPLERKTQITQESWVVIKGVVKVLLYDLDDTLIHTELLYPGDCSITLRGGHNYVCMEDDTLVYEYKTGPYMGQQKDKEFLD